jgi:hypothetical protein
MLLEYFQQNSSLFDKFMNRPHALFYDSVVGNRTRAHTFETLLDPLH